MAGPFAEARLIHLATTYKAHTDWHRSPHRSRLILCARRDPGSTLEPGGHAPLTKYTKNPDRFLLVFR
jgi:hypothetical protein